MSSWRSRSTLAVVLVLAATVVAGCGGSSTLSTRAYESQGVKALTPVLDALTTLKGNPASPAGWAKLQGASRSASSAFSKMKVASSISSLNSQLASSLGSMGTAAGKLGADISKHDATAARADLGSYQSALQSYAGAVTQLGSKGVKFVSS